MMRLSKLVVVNVMRVCRIAVAAGCLGSTMNILTLCLVFLLLLPMMMFACQRMSAYIKSICKNFLKKLRHYDEFTYYAIGEYGTTTFRPHYHAIIFFKSCSECSILDYYDLVNRLWPFGFTYPCRVNYRRLNYVLHYHTRPKEPIPGKKTFQIFSKGLGISFLDDNCIDYLVHSGKTTVRDFNGNLYVVPRYYRKKLSEMGYNLPEVTSYDKDYTVQRIEKVFNKKIYEIPTIKVASYISDLVRKSNVKISKYNNQDKFM